MTRLRIRSRRRAALVALVAIAIFVAAVVPTGDGVARSGPFGLLTLDLWLHASAYFVLELAVLTAVTEDDRLTAITLASLAVVGYGLALEGVQAFLAYRSASLLDGAANATGVLLALACWTLFVRAR